MWIFNHFSLTRLVSSICNREKERYLQILYLLENDKAIFGAFIYLIEQIVFC